MCVPAISRSANIALYRDLLRAGKAFSNYNFREYALRLVREDFRTGSRLAGADADAAYRRGRTQLDMMRRQSTVSQLFPQEKHSME